MKVDIASSAHSFQRVRDVPKWAMAHLDKYDWIGVAILALLAVLWIAHFAVPAPPPEPPPVL